MKFNLAKLAFWSKKEVKQEPVQEENGFKPKVIYNVTGKSITVILPDGEVLTANNIEPHTAELVKNSYTKTGILSLLTPETPVEEDEEEAEAIKPYLGIFEGNEDFEVVNDKVFLKGIKAIEVPPIVVAEFVDLLNRIEQSRQGGLFTELEAEYQSLKYFTLKLLANPIQDSREHLLNFVRNFDVTLTASGNMVLFRNIVSIGESNKDLIKFVSNSYLKLRSKKKGTKNFFVYDIGGGQFVLEKTNSLEGAKLIGNVYDLYHNLKEEESNRYTDNHTKKYDIRVGQVYKINEKDIELNKNGSCGGLLHCAAKNSYNYSAFGDTQVCVIVNPMFSARMDTGCSGKIGVSQMLIAAVIENQDEVPNLLDFDTEYDKITIEALEEDIRKHTLQTTSIAEVPSELSLKEVQNIASVLKSRVVPIF